MNKLVKTQDVTYEYVRRDDDGNVENIVTAVDDVSISIEDGQMVAIIGHNGSGKSTLAKHLNALLTPTEGTVWVDGIDTSDESRVWDIRQKAGMVLQNPDNQIVGQVVEEDVGFGCENLGVKTEEIWERVADALKSVDMYEYRGYSPNKLSGGQKQRVSIAGIIAMKPKCIILDEPTAMLDPKGRKEVIDAITRLNKEENVTIILITHNMEEIIGVDKIFVMDKGKLVMEGTPREVFSEVDKLTLLGLTVPEATLIGKKLYDSGLPIALPVLTKEELVSEIGRARLSKFR